MELPEEGPAGVNLRRGAVLAGYGLAGTVATAATGLAVLNLTRPVQRAVYGAVYLQVGPSDATEVAILAQFLLAATAGLAVAALAGDYLSDRLANADAIARALCGVVLLIAGFLGAVLAGVGSFLAALGVLAVAFVAVPLALRYRYGVRSGGLPAFVGGVPVVVVLLFLAGFGLGWGWGYVVIAEEVPESAVDAPVADFEAVPEVREDLFVEGDCETDGDRRECTLQLRGYEHERAAVRYLDRHGVRCPYQNSYDGDPDALFAEHDGTSYRVTCSPHGD